MKKLNTLFILITGILIISYVNDDEATQTEIEQEIRKLTQINTTDNHGEYESLFVYDSNNNVIEIRESFTELGQNSPIDIHSIVFTYQSNYNSIRTHKNLPKMSPNHFEEY